MPITSHEIVEDDKLFATVEPATMAEIKAVFAAEYDGEDTRSPWAWVRLANGDLIFGCFPRGDTYELITQTMICGRV